MKTLNGMKIRIGAVDYEVFEVNGLQDKGQELMGRVTYADCKIQLDTNVSQDRKYNVFIHELLHAIFYEAGYDDDDEEMIRRVSNVLTQVLRDNDFSFMMK